MADLNLLHGTVTSNAFGFLDPPDPTTPEHMNDGDDLTFSGSASWGAGGGQTATYEWVTDLGDTYEVTDYHLIGSIGGGEGLDPNYSDSQRSHTTFIHGSFDGSTWDSIDYSAPSGGTDDVTLTFDDPQIYRYFRYRYVEETFTGFPSFPGQSIHTWEVNGDGPVTPPVPEEPEEHPWEPQEPAHALIEIYVPDPGAYRWGEAIWGDPSVWSTARWTNVTPEHVSADLIWGTSRADAGILAQPEAGLYTFITYDPDRKLDPGNEESPYAPEIIYGLPIRVTHRGVPIRTGTVESVAYDHASKFGEIRATDNIAALAGVTFPSDVEIASTLFARARDVIAACGLPITVAPTPATGDPDVADWLEDGEFTAWHIIYHTALEALHLPWIDHLNVLQFRPWLHPSDRGSIIGSPELVNLVAYTSADQLYSIVQAMDAATETMIERRVTPLPRYGSRTHKRTIRTLDAGDWADAVLEDRSATGLRWRPGDVYPLDADSVEYHARRKIGEVLTIDYPEADPDVEVRGRILGMRVRVVDLGGTVGPDWRYNYAVSTAALSPLEADGVTPIEYLTDDETGELLYPDGVVGLEG